MADLTILDLTPVTAAEIADKSTHMLGLEVTGETTPLQLSLSELNLSLFDTTNSLTIDTGAVTDTAPVLDLAQTWNDAADTFDAAVIAVTDTASAAASRLINATVGGTSQFSVGKAGVVNAAAAGSFGFTGRAKLSSSADGIVELLNAAGDGFTRLNLGGATSSFPAVVRSTTEVHFKLADNSDFCRINPKSITLTGGTITADAPIFNATRTWNNAGVTFTALKLNVTDTASASGSLLMDLQVGGSTKFKITKDADVIGRGRWRATSGQHGFQDQTGTTTFLWLTSTACTVVSGSSFSWSSNATNPSSGSDTILIRDAANTLALRNSTNAQAFHVYNTYTSGSVYERGFMRWASNVLEIGTEHVGATARGIELTTNGSARLTITSGGSATFSGSLVATGGIGTGTPSVTINSSGSFSWNGRASMSSSANGIIELTNSAGTDFTRLNFGGTTSSFPAIKRSTTILQARLADDSAFATFQGKLQTDANAVSESITPTHTLTLYDAAGVAYKVAVQAA